MPLCNGSDRGRVLREDGSAEKELTADLSTEDDIPSPRKRADFPRVFRHERTSANRPRETSRYVSGRNACWCGSRACTRLALPRREEGLSHVRRLRARIVKAVARAAASREGRL
jgi:hypothetical protein